jgi:hypothetical protein
MIPHLYGRTGFLAALALGMAAQIVPANAQQTCAPYRDVQQIHMIDNMSAEVHTPRGDYKITFRSFCQVEERGEFFVLDRFQLGQCVSPGDVFESSGTAAPCVIESVTPLRDLVQPEND